MLLCPCFLEAAMFRKTLLCTLSLMMMAVWAQRTDQDAQSKLLKKQAPAQDKNIDIGEQLIEGIDQISPIIFGAPDLDTEAKLDLQPNLLSFLTQTLDKESVERTHAEN
jgi:hypothetical protein